MKEISREHWLLTKPVAHRGLIDTNYVENTLPAFEQCILNDTPIETDIRYTLDKKIVCFHDDSPKRLSGITSNVNELTEEEIRRITLKDNNKIVFFDELLHFVNGRVPLLIEIKHPCEKNIERDAINLLKTYTGEYALQSFDPKSLQRIKKLDHKIIFGQLIGGSANHPKLDAIKWKIANGITKPDFISHNIDTLQKNYFSLPTLVWTIRNKNQLEKAKKLADNVIFEGFENKN